MSLEFTLVRRAISLAVIDGPDAGDNPDILKAQGSVLFEPVIKKGDSIQVQTRGGSETYALAPIECPINDGIISHRGQDGVKLPAGGEAANPSLIRWKATFSRMQAGGKSFTLAPVIFDAVPGGEIDLTMVAPVAGAPEGVVRGPRGTSLESIIVDGSELVFTAVDDAGSFEIARIPLDEMVRAEADAAADGVRDALAVDVAASQSARDAAEGHASRAATSESNAATSETNAKQSETSAGDYAAVATTAATEAVDAMETVSDKANVSYVDAADQALSQRVSAIEPKPAGDVGDAAFAHATEEGHRLPLGYTSDGRLDQLARRVWAEDVTGTYEVADSEYVHAVTTGDMHLLLGVKADGTVEIPGLKSSVNEPASKWIHPDGGYYPTSVDTSAVVSWGSSSVAAMSGDFANAFAQRGITHVGRARGGEKIEHIAARMGAVPSMIYPLTIPATGGVNVVSRNVVAQNLFLAHTGWLGGVHGTLSHASGHTRFTRTSPGEEVALTSMSEFIPDEGLALRDKFVILSVGKNDMGERGAVERVLDYTDRMVKFLTPLTPCVIVMGHFIDQDTEIGGTEYQQIMSVNSALAARYGESYFDHAAALASPEIWDRTGITPTSADLDQQGNLRLPPSLAKDNQHQNDTTNIAIAEMVAELADRLGWSHK